jgi:hypothetical protein
MSLSSVKIVLPYKAKAILIDKKTKKELGNSVGKL